MARDAAYYALRVRYRDALTRAFPGALVWPPRVLLRDPHGLGLGAAVELDLDRAIYWTLEIPDPLVELALDQAPGRSPCAPPATARFWRKVAAGLPEIFQRLVEAPPR